MVIDADVGRPLASTNCPLESKTIRLELTITIFFGRFSRADVTSGLTGVLYGG